MEQITPTRAKGQGNSFFVSLCFVVLVLVNCCDYFVAEGTGILGFFSLMVRSLFNLPDIVIIFTSVPHMVQVVPVF